ncbi:hypothetical protein HQ585_19555 [candidate division KSB1 bacterium]|nr:hypothetical protein [candidate division KSB1 bacterium]
MSNRPIEEIQNDCFRRMTPGERLALSMSLYWGARNLKAAYLRAQHPGWTEKRIQAEVRDLFLYASH